MELLRPSDLAELDGGLPMQSAFIHGGTEVVPLLRDGILEADRLVDCIRRLRDAKARLYTKVEIPFVTGIRKEIAEVLHDLV